MNSLSLLLVLLVSFTALCGAQVNPTMPYSFHAYASSASVVSPVSNSTAVGQIVLQYDATALVLYATAVHNVVGATAMHLHGVALPGAAAGVIFAFTNGSSPAYISWGSVTPDQATALAAGQMYWNIHSELYPGGEIRGQVLAAGQSEVVLTPAGADASDSEGYGWGLVTFVSATNLTTAYINSNAGLGNITGASITTPSASSALVGLTTTAFPITGSGVISSDYLYSAELYLSLASTMDPSGFASGVVNPPVNYAAALINGTDPAQLAVVIVIAYPQMVYVSIAHSIVDANYFTIAGMPVPLPSYTSPIQFPITDATQKAQVLAALPTGFITMTISNGNTGVFGNAQPVNGPNTATTSTSSSSSTSVSTSSTSTGVTSSSVTTTSTASTASTSSSTIARVSTTTNDASATVVFGLCMVLSVVATLF